MHLRVAAFVLLPVALGGCRKPETLAETIDAAAIVPPPPSAVASAAIVASALPVASAESKYSFVKQKDLLGRWSLDVPTAFTKSEVKSCTDSGCTIRTSFAGDGLLVELTSSEGTDKPAAVAALLGGTIVDEKTLPRGYWVTLVVKGQHVFRQHIRGFVDPIDLQVTGPLDRKTEIEGLVGRLSSSLDVPTVRPASYCKPLPWSDGGTQATTDFDGKLKVGIGLNGKSEDEKPFILELPTAVCDAQGRACWEAQVYSDKPAMLKSLVGRDVHVVGSFHAMETAHHHRPVMISATTVGVQ